MSSLTLIQEFHAALWDNHDISAIDRFFHEDVVVASPVESTVGTAKLKEIMEKWQTGFPNLKVHWDDYITEGNKVVARWHAGTLKVSKRVLF